MLLDIPSPDTVPPNCLPNPCPSLTGSLAGQGSWDCSVANTSSCHNTRLGQVCRLNCNKATVQSTANIFAFLHF